MVKSLNPYKQFSKNKLILRDYLAVDRTILANERTFLAYLRTAFTLAILGVTFVKFFNERFMLCLGWISFLVGVFILVIGLVKYQKMKEIMKDIRE